MDFVGFLILFLHSHFGCIRGDDLLCGWGMLVVSFVLHHLTDNHFRQYTPGGLEAEFTIRGLHGDPGEIDFEFGLLVQNFLSITPFRQAGCQ